LRFRESVPEADIASSETLGADVDGVASFVTTAFAATAALAVPALFV